MATDLIVADGESSVSELPHNFESLFTKFFGVLAAKRQRDCRSLLGDRFGNHGIDDAFRAFAFDQGVAEVILDAFA